MAWTSRLPLDPRAWHAPRTLGVAFALALVTALVESLPTTLDDNLTVPLVGALTLPLLAQADVHQLLLDPDFTRRVLLGLGLNVVIALLACAAGSIDACGARLGRGHRHGDHRRARPSLLRADGRVLRRRQRRHPLGYRTKAARGIAQESGGARGMRQRLGQRRRARVPGPAWPAWPRPCFATSWCWPMRRRWRPPPPTPARPRSERPTAGAPSSSRRSGRCRRAPKARSASRERWAGFWARASWPRRAGAWAPSAARPRPWWRWRAFSAAWPRASSGVAAERRGWMGNDLLNATNTAIGAVIAVLLVELRPSARCFPEQRHEQGRRPTSISRGRSPFCRRRSGVVSGAVTAWGAGHAKPPVTWAPRRARDLRDALMAAVLNAANNAINQIYDLDIDRVNKPKRPLPSGALSLREAWAFTVADLRWSPGSSPGSPLPDGRAASASGSCSSRACCAGSTRRRRSGPSAAASGPTSRSRSRAACS